MKRSRPLRLLAISLALIQPATAALRSYGLDNCVHAGAAAIAVSHQHHHLASAAGHSHVPSHSHAGNRQSCSCDGLCQSNLAHAALPADQHQIRSSGWTISHRLDHAVAETVPPHSDHLLPFSTAPPLIA